MYSLTELEVMIGATRKTIMAWIKEGLFPGPVLRGRRRGKLFWNLDQVERALEGQGFDGAKRK
jgi:hypothetical protein